MNKHHDHLIFRIVEFGLTQTYFTFNHLARALKLDQQSQNYVWNTLTAKGTNSDNLNHLIVLVEANNEPNEKDYVYGLLPNAIIQYVDYLEIVEARKMASDANRNANIALSVTVYAIMISMLFGLWQIFFDVVPKIWAWMTT